MDRGGSGNAWPDGWARQIRVAALVIATTAAVIAAFWVLAIALGQPFRFLSREPAETLGAPRYIGAFAHVVALVWAAAAASSLLAGLVLLRTGGRRLASFHLWAGGLSTLLLADDLLLLHEAVYPRVGLREEAVYAVYAALAIGLLVRFWRELVEADALLLIVAAGAFMGASVLVDVVSPGTRHVLEVSTKAVGAGLWATALTSVAYGSLVAPRAADAGPAVASPSLVDRLA